MNELEEKFEQHSSLVTYEETKLQQASSVAHLKNVTKQKSILHQQGTDVCHKQTDESINVQERYGSFEESLINNHQKQRRQNMKRKLPLSHHEGDHSLVSLEVQNGISGTLVVKRSPSASKLLCFNDSGHVKDTMTDQTHFSHLSSRDEESLPCGCSKEETQINDAEIEEEGLGDIDDSDLQRFEPMMDIIDKIAVGERVAPQITMRYEMLRLCTLRSFPKVHKPFIIRIAQAGFYYANSGDEVVCYCCAKRKSGWRETDVPLDVHRQLSPNCRFLMSNSEVNVSVRRQEILASRRSVSAARISSAANDTENNATVGSHRIQNPHNSSEAPSSSILAKAPPSIVPQPYSTPNTGLTSTVNTMNSNTAQYNIQAPPVRSPKYPAYVTLTTRQASFRDCIELAVPADTLAEVGFFYAGCGDYCRCFQCGVGLRHWSAEDDPWIEHARWSRNCSYVREKKGEKFINLVQMAVEYRQNQERSQEPQQSTARRSGERAGSGNRNVDSLLHSDAAQSVLEMGYTPEMIRRAIQIVLNNGSSEINITPALLMEQIFAMEEYQSSQTSMTSAEKPRDQSARNQKHDGVTSPEVEGAAAASSRNATRSQSFLDELRAVEKRCADLDLNSFKASVAGISLDAEDLDSLKNNGWLTDRVIDAYLMVLKERCEDKLFVMQTFVGTFWKKGDFGENLYKEVSLTKLEWVFVPMHVNGNHWVLLVAHMPTKIVTVYDSLHKDNMNCFYLWKKFMSERARHVPHDSPEGWTLGRNLSSSQRDSDSCGTFVLLNALATVNGIATEELNHDHADAMRTYVFWTLIEASNALREE